MITVLAPFPAFVVFAHALINALRIAFLYLKLNPVKFLFLRKSKGKLLILLIFFKCRQPVGFRSICFTNSWLPFTYKNGSVRNGTFTVQGEHK